MNSTTIKGIHAPGLRILKPVLAKYLFATEKLVAEWILDEDVPWWYNERANLSLFAGGIWLSGGIAFEEFSITKSNLLKNHKNTYWGRNDLYFKIRGRGFHVEAKRMFFSGFAGYNKTRSRIQRINSQLANDVQLNQSFDTEGLSILFAIPRFPINRKGSTKSTEGLIAEWIKMAKSVKCSACAWTFPGATRNIHNSSGNRLFPGVTVFINKVK